MIQSFVMTGTLADGMTVRLDDPLPVTAGRVAVTVTVLEPEPTGGPRPSFTEWLAELRRQQDARGFVPRPAEEIDADIRELRGE
ncbi:MAG: hypothetical protein K2X82_15275 [Gemmataceae bacterium]|nr:hypothetical protein [Gemmataceae bacterium]